MSIAREGMDFGRAVVPLFGVWLSELFAEDELFGYNERE
jgi:hypothetical protein